jgi:hypothetical protein
VNFGAIQAEVLKWTDTGVDVVVLAMSVPGEVILSNSQGSGNTVVFTPLPEITGIEPSGGRVGDTLTIGERLFFSDLTLKR